MNWLNVCGGSQSVLKNGEREGGKGRATYLNSKLQNILPCESKIIIVKVEYSSHERSGLGGTMARQPGEEYAKS